MVYVSSEGIKIFISLLRINTGTISEDDSVDGVNRTSVYMDFGVPDLSSQAVNFAELQHC